MKKCVIIEAREFSPIGPKPKKTKPAVWKAEESNCKVEFSRKWTVLSEWTVKAPICWTFTACAMVFYPHSIPEM